MAFLKCNIPGRQRANINAYYSDNAHGLRELSTVQKGDIQGLVSLLGHVVGASLNPAGFDSGENMPSPHCLESVSRHMSIL